MEWARVVGSGDAFDVSFRIRRFDGLYRWFKTRATPLRDPAGRILKWFGSNTDIEDFVNASNRLEVQLERMQLLDRTTHAIGAHQEARKVFEVVLRSLEENLGVDFACICLYQAEPRRLTVTCVGERSLAVARTHRTGGARADRRRTAACWTVACMASWCYEAAIDDRSAPFLRPLAAADCARWCARRCGSRATKCSACCWWPSAAAGLLQQRRPRIPAATVQPRGAGHAPGAAVRRARGAPTRTCARPSRR